jgi:alpha-D-ribose 1-methylphosphonate 5-triphosphate diphosphatase
MMDIAITGGPSVVDGRIAAPGPARLTLDATGLDILPGLIDVHGDAFERALSPRPGVMLPVAIALAETEAQLLAAGITTAYLAVTLSWEAGLRSRESYILIRDALAARPAGAVPDLKLHVRFEAHNLTCLDLLIADIAAGHVAMVSFNDHTPGIVSKLDNPAAAAKFMERAGQNFAAFAADASRAAAASPQAIEAGRRRLADAARKAGIPMASHDDDSLEVRATFRALGAQTSEFPMSVEVAQDAISRGEHTVMGAPNVVRGGSHLGWHGAEALVKLGFCSVLCSDYHYPSMLHAPYIIARNQTATFADAAALVTANPAKLAGLEDRGSLATGSRADIILVTPGPTPKLTATIAAGRLAYIAPEALPLVIIKS